MTIWLPPSKRENDYDARYDEAEEILLYLTEKSKNVHYYKELEDYIRPNPDMYIPNEWNFYYLKILNEEGLEEVRKLLRAVSVDESYLLSNDIGKVICLEHPADNLLDLYCKTWDEITCHLIEIYETFGLKMTVTEMK